MLSVPSREKAIPAMQRTIIVSVLSVAFWASSSLSFAHVPHDIIYSLDLSPNFADDGIVLSSSTQFGEGHLISTTYGETFVESHAGMSRTLVTGHTFSPNFSADGVVFAATKQGYYRSDDRGRSWTKQTAFPNDHVLAVCFTGDGQSVFVLTETQLARVTANQLSETIREFEPATFGTMILANGRLIVHRVFFPKPETRKGMDYVEYTRGSVEIWHPSDETWSVLSPTTDVAIVADVAVSHDGQTFIASTKQGGVYRTDDGGQTWSKVYQREGDFVCKLALSPDFAADRTIALGTAKGFVVLSEDGGQTWNLRSDGLSRWVHHVNILINQLRFSPNYRNDKTLFLGKTTGVHKSTDAGRSWRHVNIWSLRWGYYVLPSPAAGSRDVFAATYNGGLYRSSDLGDSWASANIGITSAFANGMELSPNYADDKTIFAMDITTGLYRSNDAGKSWSQVDETDVTKPAGNLSLYRELGVSSEFTDDGLVYLFTVPRRTIGAKEKHSWRFNDNTKKLTPITIGRGSNYVQDFGFTPSGSRRKSVFCASSQGGFVSDDDGEHWRKVVSGRRVEKVIVSPNYDADGVVYFKTANGQLVVSKDGGDTFNQANFRLGGRYIDNLTFSPLYATDRTLYVTTYGDGLLRSTDAGATWSAVGLRGKLIFTGPTFSASYADDKTIFAPAIDGIYRTTDDGQTWANVLDLSQILPKEPLVTLTNADGRQVPLTYGVPDQMKEYGVLDREATKRLYPPSKNAFRKLKDSRAYLASYYKFDVDAGAHVDIDFFGSSIELICVQGPDLGVVEIELDGESQGTFDLYGGQTTFDVSAFSKTSLRPGFHTLTMRATGTKHAGSRGHAMTFNAANVGSH